MQEKFLKIFKSSLIIRYLVVGGTSYIIELSSLLAIYHFGHTSRELATAISYWIGLIIAFSFQKLVAFQDYRREIKAISKQGLFFAILTLWNYIFTILVVGHINSKYIVFSRTLAQIVFSCWNYFIYKKIIFNDKTN
jgi:putative flippase GtrA